MLHGFQLSEIYKNRCDHYSFNNCNISLSEMNPNLDSWLGTQAICLIKNVSKGLRGKTSNGKNGWFGLMVLAIAISL